MLGYLLAVLALVLVLALLIPILAARRAPRPHGGTLASDEDHPVARTEPASDEATPAVSVTASEGQKEKAARRTPPG